MLRESGFLENDADDEDIFDRFKRQQIIPVWEPPIPFDIINLPDFPVNDLPVTVSAYVRAVAETTQTSPDMAAVASLAILSLCLQGKFTIEGKQDWKEPLNLYAIVVANPAERKSAVIALMSEPIKLFEANENKTLAPLIEKSKIEKNILEKKRKVFEDKAAHKSNEVGYNDDGTELDDITKEISEFEEIKPCRLFCDDITPERLSGVLNENAGKTAIISSEGGIFDLMAGRYSQNINIDVFLKAHSGDSIRVDRQGRASEYIRNPALTALIFAQPNVIENLMSNGIFRGRGLCARFLYSIPASTVGTRRFRSTPISDITSEQYYKLVEKLLRIKNDTPKIVRLSEKARLILQAFYEKIEPMLIDELADISDFAGKFVGMTLRIAGLLYLADNSDSGELILSESYMESAIVIGEYFLEHAKAAYQIMGSDKITEQCKYILRLLKKSKTEKITVRDIMRTCRKFKTADETLIPLNRLCEYGYLKEVQSKTWDVNPIVYE